MKNSVQVSIFKALRKCAAKKHLNFVQPSVSFYNIYHIKAGASQECTSGNAVLGQACKSVGKFL